MAAAGGNKRRNYEEDKTKLKSFLAEFHVREARDKKRFVYAPQLTALAHREQTALTIELEHLREFDPDLAEAVIANTRRYTLLLSDAVWELLPDYKEREPPARDALDVYINHRMLMEARTRGDSQAASFRPSNNRFPPELMRRYEVYFRAPSDLKPLVIRDVKASSIGKLVNVRGVVTRATEVKPMMQVATYACDQCGAETYQPVAATAFMPLLMCPAEDCRVNRSGGRLHLQTRGSKFVKFQELRIQEHSDAVPTGSIPRSISVYCRGETTRLCVPGNHVSVDGVYLPIAKTGFKAMMGGLLTDTYLEAHRVVQLNKTEDEEMREEDAMTEEELRTLQVIQCSRCSRYSY